MSTAFTELESQLRSAVRRSRAQRTTWARHRRRQTWVLAAAALLVVSAGAFGASRIIQGKSAQEQGRELAFQTVRETEHLTACRALETSFPYLTFTDAPVLGAITRLLPLLGRPPSQPEQARASALLPRQVPTGGAVLTQTLHLVTLQEGIRVLAFVTQGGWATARNPAACARARQARAQELTANHPAAIRRWARVSLERMPDTAPGVQTLVTLIRDPSEAGEGGGAQPIVPGQRLKPGVQQVSGSRDGSRLFFGIAGADATAVRIQTRQLRALHRLPTQVPVRARLYAVKIPRGLGPFRLLEIGATGTILRSIE